MSPDELQTYLHKLMETHGLRVARYNNWLVPNGELPGLRGAWFPPDEEHSVGEFSVQVLLEDKRIVDECFAGPGEPGEGLKYALQGFQTGTLHVLLAALWDSVYEDHVNIEEWSWSGKNWRVYAGDFVVRFEETEPLEHPVNLFDLIEQTLKGIELSDDIHWLRIYYGSGAGTGAIAEALLDNEPWEELKTAISGAEWPSSDHYYSVRNFLVLKPVAA